MYGYTQAVICDDRQRCGIDKAEYHGHLEHRACTVAHFALYAHGACIVAADKLRDTVYSTLILILQQLKRRLASTFLDISDKKQTDLIQYHESCPFGAEANEI